MQSLFRRGRLRAPRHLLLLIGGALATGTFGFWIIEGWTFLDSFYMTVVTLSTVGYGEVHQLTDTGRLFAAGLIIFGVGTAAYTFGVIGQFVVEGQLRDLLGKRKMEKQLLKLKQHYIICGFGRVGREVCNQFSNRKVPFVVIENDTSQLQDIIKNDYLLIEGDATEDQILKAAGIERARGLVSAIASEAENVYLALSARHLNGQLTITCRADSAEAEKKIYRAGADRVISPYVIGGLRMALATLRPNVVDFLQIATSGPEGNFRIEELLIEEQSPMANMKLKDIDLRAKQGITVLGIRKPGKKMHRNPSADTAIQSGDILILLGEARQLEGLTDL